MSEWQDIKTAPRDGTTNEVWADGMLSDVMRWDPQFVSPLMDAAGCWVAVEGSYVWSEGRDCGPTHWRPVTQTNG